MRLDTRLALIGVLCLGLLGLQGDAEAAKPPIYNSYFSCATSTTPNTFVWHQTNTDRALSVSVTNHDGTNFAHFRFWDTSEAATATDGGVDIRINADKTISFNFPPNQGPKGISCIANTSAINLQVIALGN